MSSALSSRDANVPSTASPFETKKQVATGAENKQQVHKNLLEKRITANNGGQSYVSPSDAILSPASQKLSSFKQKQINKTGKDSTRRSLFGRTPSTNSEQGSDNPTDRS